MQNSFSDFSLTLINTRKKQYLTLGWCSLLLNAAVLLYAAFSLGPQQVRPLLTIGLFVPLAGSIIGQLSGKKKETHYRIINRSMLFMAGAWLLTGFYWVAGALLVLVVLFRLSLRTLLVTFCEQGINYPAVPKKLIPWKNVANVIVKDNLLTIDLVSNHLIQQPIDKNSFIDEAELLAFHTHCQQQIKKA